MVPALLVLSVGLVVFGVMAVVRKRRVSRVSDYLPPQVLTRIIAEYPELPQ